MSSGASAAKVQSALLARDHYTLDEAKAWARRHKLRYAKVHTTAKYYRLRQFEPDSSKGIGQ